MPESQTTVALRLYGTSACHLCELAEALLAQLLLDKPYWQIELVDIADSDELIARYGERIPVLQHTASAEELGWPFDGEAVVRFVEGRRQ